MTPPPGDSFLAQSVTGGVSEKRDALSLVDLASAEILRRAGSLSIPSIFAPALSALRSALRSYHYPDSEEAWLVSDLSLGAWRSHQVARDFFTQLGYDKSEWACILDNAMAKRTPNDRRERDAETLGKLIDSESSGNTEAIRALTFARALTAEVAGRAPYVFLVFMPRFGISWRVENLAFLEFLRQALSESAHRLILVAGAEDVSQGPGHWQLEWLTPPPQTSAANAPAQATGPLGLIPGVIEAEVARVLARLDETTSYIKLSGELLLVDPKCRRKLSPMVRLEYDKLGALRVLPDDCRAIAQLHGNIYYGDPDLLCREAWRLAGEGASDIAMDLMKRAAACCRSKEQQARLLLDLQGLRIASQQFEEAADITDPNAALSAEIRGSVLQTKGWALTFLGRANAGRTCLAAARRLLAPSLAGSRRFLYLNNIYALSLLKSGDPNGALKLEKEIELELDKHAVNEGRRDWQLTYVNAINQARLYRILGDFEHSLAYFQRSFQTARGVRSESDMVYFNVCLGRLFGEHGRMREAFNCWMRAGLHWVSAQIPEALARRVSMSILHRRVEAGEHVEEEIARALHKQILEAARAASVPLVDSHSSNSPVFRNSPPVNQAWRNGAMMVAGDGWPVVVTHSDCRAVYDGPQTELLRGLLFSIIRQSAPLVAWDGIRSLFVEDALGLEQPETISQVVNTAIRLGLEKIIYQGCLIELPESRQKRLEAALSVGMGAAVSDVREIEREQVVVTFKRYLEPQILAGLDAQLISRIESQPSIADLLTAFPAIRAESIIACVRRLETARIINLELSSQALSSEISESELALACVASPVAGRGLSIGTQATGSLYAQELQGLADAGALVDMVSTSFDLASE